MTLNTEIRIDTGERDPDQVAVTATNIFFNVVRAMVWSTDETKWGVTEPGEHGTWPLNRRLFNHLSQGLPAAADVEHGAPLLLERDYDGDPDSIIATDPAGTIAISFDTAYSYRNVDGNQSCGDLHAIYVKIIGQACEHVGWTYHWHNEFTGQWHNDWRTAADELGEGATAATDWFHNMVQPIMDAEAAVEGVELEWQ